MDLSNLKNVEEPVKCVLENPVTGEVIYDDDGEQMYIAAYGKDSPEYKRALNVLINRQVTKKEKTKSLDKSIKDAIELLASVTTDWNIVINGEKPKCTKEEAVKLYSDWTWIKEQVDLAIHDRANFFTN